MDNWKTGTIKIGEEIFQYFVKCFEETSAFGIDEGRISKLWLEREHTPVCSYDRGWDIEARDENTRAALAILMKEYN